MCRHLKEKSSLCLGLSTRPVNEIVQVCQNHRLHETSIVDRHRCLMAAKFRLFVDEDHSKFLRYTGYLNVINGPISRVLLLILVHVQLRSCLFF